MPKNLYPNNIVFHGEEMNQVISMKPEFKIERKAMRFLPVNDPENVYISPEKQTAYLVHFDNKNHEFVDAKGNPLDGEYNFVLTCEAPPKLLCDLNLNHSFLSNGKKVLGVGSLLFENGCLHEVTNNSGHYRPTDNEMLPFIKAMNTMSGGTVFTYKSYCTLTPKTFGMEGLLDINDFSEVQPSEKNTESGSASKQRQNCSGYDEYILIEPKEEDTFKRRRFGHNISKERLSQYQKILKNSMEKENNNSETIQSQLNIKNQLDLIKVKPIKDLDENLHKISLF